MRSAKARQDWGGVVETLHSLFVSLTMPISGCVTCNFYAVQYRLRLGQFVPLVPACGNGVRDGSHLVATEVNWLGNKCFVINPPVSVSVRDGMLIHSAAGLVFRVCPCTMRSW